MRSYARTATRVGNTTSCFCYCLYISLLHTFKIYSPRTGGTDKTHTCFNSSTLQYRSAIAIFRSSVSASPYESLPYLFLLPVQYHNNINRMRLCHRGERFGISISSFHLLLYQEIPLIFLYVMTLSPLPLYYQPPLSAFAPTQW